jgi:hypothetical protein
MSYQPRFPPPPLPKKNLSLVRSASCSERGVAINTLTVVVVGERYRFERTGHSWTPGTAFPRDAQPNAPAALARHAEAHEQNEREQIRTRRKAA